jgi:hypothetical protein
VSRTEVHHAQWPLQHAEAEIAMNTMLTPFHLVVNPAPPFLHFSRRLDVLVWSPI